MVIVTSLFIRLYLIYLYHIAQVLVHVAYSVLQSVVSGSDAHHSAALQLCITYGGVPGGQGKLTDDHVLASAKCQVNCSSGL